MAEKEDPMLSPDMNRYYYRPGTTEPELRPEFVEAEVAEKKEGQGVKADDYKAPRNVAKKK